MAAKMRIRLPDNLVIRGALNREVSQFGDIFLNSPFALGKRPPAGRTFLSGWIEVRFELPQGNVADFTLDYEAYGTDETLTWGGGQMFHMSRNRLTPLRVLPGGMQGANRARLNLETGLVEAGSIVLCAAFQNSLIGAVGALNRIPFAFPFVYPVPP